MLQAALLERQREWGGWGSTYSGVGTCQTCVFTSKYWSMQTKPPWEQDQEINVTQRWRADSRLISKESRRSEVIQPITRWGSSQLKWRPWLITSWKIFQIRNILFLWIWPDLFIGMTEQSKGPWMSQRAGSAVYICLTVMFNPIKTSTLCTILTVTAATREYCKAPPLLKILFFTFLEDMLED